MPALGMAQETGTVLRWLKEGGARVAKGEPLVEVETDKVTVEIESPADGTLASVTATPGIEVPVGSVIAIVLAAGEEAGTIAPPVVATVMSLAHEEPPMPQAAPAARALASPKARRLAQTLGVDLEAIAGSGPGGAIVAQDVEVARTAPSLELGPVWRLMADRMVRAWQEVPQFVLSREVDASELHDRSAGISVTDVLVQSCAEALHRHPRMTSSWCDGALVPGKGINIGVAVATEEALVVPVIHEADRLTLAEISARRRNLAEAARAGRLRPDDVQGATFTISNLGMYGVDAFQAIVNAPQAAILAVGRIVERPVAIGGLLAVRPRLTLTISFDHRVVDGARGAEFLETLALLVEEPAGTD